MDSKLTLNVNKELSEKAKLYARSRGRSLSDLVENYFKFLTSKTDHSQADIPSNVKSLLGSFKVPAEADYKKDLTGQLLKKYY